MEKPGEEKKLSVIAILIIIGISSLLFTLTMKLLDGVILQLFFRVGIVCLSAGLFLLLLKQLVKLQSNGKRAENSHQ